MGKPTGFMDYQRQDCHVIPPEERIGNWKEFKPLLSREEQQRQVPGVWTAACPSVRRA